MVTDMVHRTIYALSGDTIELPERASWRHIRFPGYRLTADYVPDDVLEALPTAFQIIRTICPWLPDTYAGPELWSELDDEEALEIPSWRQHYWQGTRWKRINGVTFSALAENGEGIALALNTTATGLIRTAFHECFHIISPYLTPAAHRVLEQHTSNGYGWTRPYHQRAEERKARMFESWTNTLFEGWQPRPFALPRDGSLCLESLFDGIYSGEIGKKILRDMETEQKAAA